MIVRDGHIIHEKQDVIDLIIMYQRYNWDWTIAAEFILHQINKRKFKDNRIGIYNNMEY